MRKECTQDAPIIQPSKQEPTEQLSTQADGNGDGYRLEHRQRGHRRGGRPTGSFGGPSCVQRDLGCSRANLSIVRFVRWPAHEDKPARKKGGQSKVIVRIRTCPAGPSGPVATFLHCAWRAPSFICSAPFFHRSIAWQKHVPAAEAGTQINTTWHACNPWRAAVNRQIDLNEGAKHLT